LSLSNFGWRLTKDLVDCNTLWSIISGSRAVVIAMTKTPAPNTSESCNFLVKDKVIFRKGGIGRMISAISVTTLQIAIVSRLAMPRLHSDFLFSDIFQNLSPVSFVRQESLHLDKITVIEVDIPEVLQAGLQ